MSKVVLEGYIDVPDADLDFVKTELPKHIELTREESGCLVFSVEQDKSNRNRFDVYEVFASQEAFDAHQDRVKSSRWGAITKNVQRNYCIRRT